MRTALGLVILAAILAHAAPARADAAAEALFGEGRDLMAAGKIAEACDKYQRSQLLEPKVGTLLNLGDCRERQGQLANAWAAFMEASSLAIRDHDEDRSTEARRRAALLEPSLGSVTIKVTPTPGLVITRNGQPVPAAAWDTSVPVDPGAHAIAASAPGYLPWSGKIEVAVGAHGDLAVPALAIDPAARLPEVPAGPFVVKPAVGRFGFGLAFGGTSDSDIVGGARLVANYPVPRGAIRATFQALYGREHPEEDPYHLVERYGLNLGFDYLLGWGDGLASAAGIGFGMDVVDDNYENGLSSNNWFSLRASPLIVRLTSPRLELGLHLLFVTSANILVGVVGVDWFVW
jgi:hypothetical protein